jgi:putative ABC transport system substrate-binding protein
MLNTLKRLLLGIALIFLASLVLLLSDLNRRASGGKGVPRIGLLQHASVAVLDDGVRGMVDGLGAKGFVEGKTIVIEKYNSEGDIAVANSIAKQMVNARYDLLMTCSTISLQAVAGANRGSKTVQVFGLSADPAGAGVGISRENPLQHPPNLVGYGCFLPAAESFRMAKRLYPGLKAVGVAWNPAESNSRAFTESARGICPALGIELLEATVEHSNGVLEAEKSLISRGADAIWVGGDVTVSVAISVSSHPKVSDFYRGTRLHPERRSGCRSRCARQCGGA